jgi:hypothetical protein
VTTPWVNDGLATVPYLTLAEFRAMPTWIDNSNLIENGAQVQQDAELLNVLLRASSWADNYCNQRLQAHLEYEQMRAQMDRHGRLYLHPKSTPVRQVTGLAYGFNFQSLTVLEDLTQIWVEDSRGIVASVIPLRGMWSGSLEFGGSGFSGAECFVELQYVAGFANTTLAATAAQGASSLTVTDPTGIQPPASGTFTTLSGSTLRIFDPALEEAVTVSTGYEQGQATVPLTGELVNTHAAGAGISELPPEVKQAVCCLAVALLMREDVTAEDPFPSTPFGPTLRRGRGQAGGLVDTAWQLLDPFRRIR